MYTFNQHHANVSGYPICLAFGPKVSDRRLILYLLQCFACKAYEIIMCTWDGQINIWNVHLSPPPKKVNKVKHQHSIRMSTVRKEENRVFLF